MAEPEKGDFQAAIERLKISQEQNQAKSTGKTNQNLSNDINRDELEKCGIFKRYWHCTFEKIEKRGVPQQIQHGYGKVKKYAEDIDQHVQDGLGMILKGPVGTMKTSFAVAVLQKYIKSGGSGLFIPMSSLLDNLFTLKERNKEEWARYEERIRKTGLLILDDLGAEYHQEWVMSKVDAIISERYNRMRPIIITSNLSDSQMKGLYTDRAIDRLRATSITIKFEGGSLRDNAVIKQPTGGSHREQSHFSRPFNQRP